MKFYVPEIGDEIVLEEDWEFSLHPESRNRELGEFFNHYMPGFGFVGWIEKSQLPPMREIDFKVNYPTYGVPNTFFGKKFSHEIYEKECKLAEENCQEWIQWQKDNEDWKSKCSSLVKPLLKIVLPKGTKLKIDRIYIRKGIKDFSSITFRANNLGEIEMSVPNIYNRETKKKIKKKSFRFWAKLNDCNNIIFK